MNKKILLTLSIIIVILIITVPVLYLMLQKTQETKMTGPNPTEEYQKFINDKTITRIYSGVLPCNNCDGIEKVISISRDSDDAKEGKFSYSETYFGSENDAFTQSGTWKLQSKDDNNVEAYILVFPDGNEKKYERIDEVTIVEIDKNGERMQENGKDLVLTLLN